VHDGVTLEQAGLPTVTLIAPEFLGLANAKKESMGLHGFEPVVVPFDPHLRMFGNSREDVRAAAEAVYDRIIHTLIWGPGRQGA
jgi:hypothetical protein